MQKKITTEAANGYCSYGNQIGLTTGQVSEVYDEDFVAKRMEIGAVIAAVTKRKCSKSKTRSWRHNSSSWRKNRKRWMWRSYRIIKRT